MEVFNNLGEKKANKIYNDFIAKGLSEDDAFTETYAIECNLDQEEE